VLYLWYDLVLINYMIHSLRENKAKKVTFLLVRKADLLSKTLEYMSKSFSDRLQYF